MRKYAKKFDQYLAALHAAPMQALDTGTTKASRFYVGRHIGSVSIVAITDGEPTKMLMVDQYGMPSLSTVSGQVLVDAIASSDIFAVARSTQIARTRLIVSLCKERFYKRFDPVFNLACDVLKATGDRTLFDSVVELRKDFFEQSTYTEQSMKMYMQSIAVLHRAGNAVMRIVSK